MSYTPTTWETGDTVTPAKLNKIEQGIYDADNGAGGSSALIVLSTFNSGDQQYVMNQTANSIINALASGIPVFVKETSHSGNLTISVIKKYTYANNFYMFSCDNMLMFRAYSLNEYPYAMDEGE